MSNNEFRYMTNNFKVRSNKTLKYNSKNSLIENFFSRFIKLSTK